MFEPSGERGEGRGVPLAGLFFSCFFPFCVFLGDFLILEKKFLFMYNYILISNVYFDVFDVFPFFLIFSFFHFCPASKFRTPRPTKGAHSDRKKGAPKKGAHSGFWMTQGAQC